MTARSLEERQARELLRKAAKERARAEEQRPRIEKAKGSWERPVLPPRPKLSEAQKLQVHEAHDGCCWLCGEPCPATGPDVQYDHKLERWEKVDDGLENLGPAHTVPCHARKSAKKTAERAHVYAMARKNAGEKKPGKKIPNRGFNQGYRPMASGRRG